MTRPFHSLLIPVLACTPGQTQDEPVVMVADLAGKALRGNGQPLALAEGIPAHRGLTLAAGARLVVIHLKTGEELTFTGPGSFRFDGEGRPLGAKPAGQRKVAALGAGFRLEPGAWAQASVVIRKEVMPGGSPFQEAEEPMPFSPTPLQAGVWLQPRGTAILETLPEFRWRLPRRDKPGRFWLEDAAGIRLVDEVVHAEGLRLPDGKALPPGGTYRWSLSWTALDGREQSEEGTFEVLPEAETRLIRSLRPAPDASFAERLTFAVALETRGLAEEAQPYWRRLAAERPGDGTLQRFVTP